MIVEPAVTENLPEHKAANILLVEDQLDSIRALSQLLTQQGYKVRKAINGRMAITAAIAELPDLILLDINLPILDGFEVCQKLKEDDSTKDIPIIFLSAMSDYEYKAKAFQAGGSDYITKPFQAEEVLMRVRNQLMLSQQQRQLRWQNTLLMQEIRDRQRAEEAAQQTEAKYRSIFENATEGIFQATLDRQYINVNPAMSRILGYDSPDDLVSSVSDISKQIYVQPKRLAELKAYVNHFGYISESESEVYRKDGSTIWITENIWLVKDSSDQPICLEGTVQDISDRHRMEALLRQRHEQSERLLFNVLPYQIAQRLRTQRKTIAESFDDVTVMFADLVGFTTTSTQMPPSQLVDLLNQIFSKFDLLAERYDLEKIKTIGDAYMVAAGLPVFRPDHAEAIANMALDMQLAIAQFKKPSGESFQLRIGINTGSVVAGVIGVRKFAYDLWGDTVNTASRMESTGKPGRIQITNHTYKRLRHIFTLKKRGTVFVKGKGEMVTYWLEGKR